MKATNSNNTTMYQDADDTIQSQKTTVLWTSTFGTCIVRTHEMGNWPT